jgi:capsular polysaccharide biosynthesis protein
MSISRKIIFAIIGSILFIASVNILGFYVFYSSNLKIYLAERNKARENITLDYVNEITKKQTEDDI